MTFQHIRRYSACLLSGLATLAAIQSPASSAAPADVIYLESNSTAGNSIFAYGFNFTSSPILLSTTPAGGIGVYDPSFALGPFDSDQNLIEDASGTMLFAVNSGSNSVAVFHIQPDGNLVAVNGSLFPSGGSDPVSLGLKDDVLAVVNKDQDPAQNGNLVLPNYTSFRVLPGGRACPGPSIHGIGGLRQLAFAGAHGIAGGIPVRGGFSGWIAAILPSRSARPLEPESSSGIAGFNLRRTDWRPSAAWDADPPDASDPLR